MDRLSQQVQFIIEIDKLKKILRRSYVTGDPRLENDAEHSWHLAMMVVLLREHACATDIDVSRAVKMALVHDLVEIHAGDAFLYDPNGAAAKAEQEKAAAEKLYSLLPRDQATELVALWEEFEAHETPEAKYVRALDRLQPLLLNREARGRTWQEHNITAEMALALNPPIIESGAPGVAGFARDLLLGCQEQGYFAVSKPESR